MEKYNIFGERRQRLFSYNTWNPAGRNYEMKNNRIYGVRQQSRFSYNAWKPTGRSYEMENNNMFGERRQSRFSYNAWKPAERSYEMDKYNIFGERRQSRFSWNPAGRRYERKRIIAEPQLIPIDSNTKTPARRSYERKRKIAEPQLHVIPIVPNTMTPARRSYERERKIVEPRKEPIDFSTKTPAGRSSERERKIVEPRKEPIDFSTKTPAGRSSVWDANGKPSEDWKSEEIRIVLIGKTGSGKSATANTILGEKMFASSVSGSSVTRKCSKQRAVRFGKKILIVDTPGIFDTRQSNENINEEIEKCIAIASPGPHAIIMVLPISRYTEEDHKSVMHFVKCFGNDIFQYFIVLFTRKDDLDEEGQTIQQYIETVPTELKLIIQKCGGRVVAFNNRLKGKENDPQVEELLSMILINVERNNGRSYTDIMYLKAKLFVKEKELEELKRGIEKDEKHLKAVQEVVHKRYDAKLANIQKGRQKMHQQYEERKIQNQQHKKVLETLRQQHNQLEWKVKYNMFH